MSNLSLDVPKTIEEVATLMYGRRDKSKRLTSDTSLEFGDFGACVIYYSTPIITYFPESFTITNGDYYTAGMKTRLNAFLKHYGYKIVTHKGEWYYASLKFKAVLVPFKNGDTKEMIDDRFAYVNGSVH